MKSVFKFTAFVLLTGVLFYISCKKDYSCESCDEKNKPPIANAGLDQTITLPTYTVSLDGTSSSDPDGRISDWLWTKISGPASFNITKASDSVTKVKSLIVGVYQFELKVTDAGGLFSKDTMRVIVDSVITTNHPPIANAGRDTTITLPTHTVNLDGSGSTDPENNITIYLWTKISGPSSFNIANTNIAQTQVTNLVQGTYQIELKVMDAGRLFANDTIQINVTSVSNTNCSRPIIPAQLIPFGNLSVAREGIVIASARAKILFAGGIISPEASLTGISRVDIYDTITHTWSIAELSIARLGFTAVSFGNRIFFAGGSEGNCLDNCINSRRIDIYDASTNTWSIAEFSVGRSALVSAVVGNKIFFAGEDIVDIYDTGNNTWSTASLSQGRHYGLTATTAGNKIYFAGGFSGGAAYPSGNNITDRIDIYDAVTNSWSTSTLAEPKTGHASIATGNKIYWAGGLNLHNYVGANNSSLVEIRDVNTQISSYGTLCQRIDNLDAVLKHGKIAFMYWPSGNHFDIYDPSPDTWYVGLINQDIGHAGVRSINNTIYVAGGLLMNSTITNQIWSLEF